MRQGDPGISTLLSDGSPALHQGRARLATTRPAPPATRDRAAAVAPRRQCPPQHGDSTRRYDMATRVRDQVVTRFTLIVLLSLMLLGMASTAALPRAEAANQPNNIVLEWNQHAIDAFSNPATAPTPGAGMLPQVSILHIAMVQGAIYDAVMMIERTHQPYNAGLPAAPRTASKTAAVATAAHRVIVGVQVTPALSPAIIARVNARLADSIAAATSADGTAAVQAGIAAGEAAAQAMLEVRANDGRFVPTPVEAGDQPGQWRPTPPTN